MRASKVLGTARPPTLTWTQVPGTLGLLASARLPGAAGGSFFRRLTALRARQALRPPVSELGGAC